MPTESLGTSTQRADGATLAVLFVLVLTLTPARLAIRGLPISLTPADVVGLGLLVFWFCSQLTISLGGAKGRNALRTALFLYLVTVLLTYGYATVGYLPPDELKLVDHSLVGVMSLTGIALVVCDGVRGRDRLDFLLKAVVVACTIVAFIGALQFLIGLDLTKYLVLPVFRYAADSGIVDTRNSLMRAASTTGHPIEFGVLCVIVLPFALYYGLRSRGWSARGWWLCTAVIAAGLMFSVSRSAVGALAGVGLVLLLGWSWRRRVLALAGTVAFLGAMKLAVPGLVGTYYGLFAYASSDPSITARTHRYPQVMHEIAKHVWLGRGTGSWYFPKFFALDNQYLMTLVDSGVIGLVAFVGLLLAGICVALRARSLTADVDQRDLGLAFAAALIGPMIGAATFDLLSFRTVTGLMFLLLGATGALLRIVGPPQAGDSDGVLE
ncbi:MAG: O-antigen ligase family protein, partial [Pseudonocardiaceae bacterium]